VRRRLLAGASACALVAGAVAGCGGGGDAGGYTVRAIFDSAPFIINGLDVKTSGVKIGTVKSVDLTDDNHAAVTLTITDPGFQDFRKDANCSIRPQALIGERYIECSLTQQRPDGATGPGPLPTIANGEYKGEHLLPVDRTFVAIDSDQVLDVNTASVRERFGIIIRELGTGLAGRGDEIGNALRKGNQSLTLTNQILKQLSDQTDMLKQLESSSDQALASLANERASLSGTIVNGAKVTGTLARRETQVKQSITALNALLTEVKPTADRANDLAEQLTPIADDLNRSSSDIATVLNLLPELSSRGTTAVNSLGPTLSKASDVLNEDTTTALIDRLVKTATAVKASGSVLGLTLGDFRDTGGLDYFLDAIYNLAYATNGRDAGGSYLRGATANLIQCAIPSLVAPNSCGTALASDITLNSAGAAESATSSSSSSGTAARKTATTPKSTTPAPSTPKSTSPSASTPKTTQPSNESVDAKSAELLLGGSQ
jgi:ABC-type transporter Mla subunit MlaD